MASHVWVIYETAADGGLNLIEAHATSESATAAANELQSDVEIQKIELKKGGEGKAKGAKAKGTTSKKSAKSAAADSDENDGDEAGGAEGIPNALAGLKLLFTGTMQVDRKTCEATAKEYGAEIASKILNADYVVLGTKPGPKKVDEINEHGLETLSESEFFQMLKTGVPKDKRNRMAAKAAEKEGEAGPQKKKQKK